MGNIRGKHLHKYSYPPSFKPSSAQPIARHLKKPLRTECPHPGSAQNERAPFNLKYVNWKDRKAIAADLKIIYAASTEEAAQLALAAFRATHDTKHPAIGRSWEANWDPLTPFLHFPPEIRKIIYTTNAIESLNSSFRKISRHRNLFPTIHSLFKLFYLSLKNISRKWTLTLPNWPSVLSHFAIKFENRMPNNR